MKYIIIIFLVLASLTAFGYLRFQEQLGAFWSVVALIGAIIFILLFLKISITLFVKKKVLDKKMDRMNKI